MLASRFGHREIAQLLVDRGTDVNTQEKVGNCNKKFFLLLECCVSVLEILGLRPLHLFSNRMGGQHSCLLVVMATERLHSCW